MLSMIQKNVVYCCYGYKSAGGCINVDFYITDGNHSTLNLILHRLKIICYCSTVRRKFQLMNVNKKMKETNIHVVLIHHGNLIFTQNTKY